jgi:hypothetical protein
MRLVEGIDKARSEGAMSYGGTYVDDEEGGDDETSVSYIQENIVDNVVNLIPSRVPRYSDSGRPSNA